MNEFCTLWGPKLRNPEIGRREIGNEREKWYLRVRVATLRIGERELDLERKYKISELNNTNNGNIK